MKVKHLLEFLKTCNQDEPILSFVWLKEDAEAIIFHTQGLNHPIILTDEQWQSIADRLSNKSEWLHDGIHEDICDRYNQLKEGE